jgi:DNA topoisomerase I
VRPATFTVAEVEERPTQRAPAAPFITSTLQQEAARKLRFTLAAHDAGGAALYENGYITYMRTDDEPVGAGDQRRPRR